MKHDLHDEAALARVGKMVRRRLDANPLMHRLTLAVDCAEIYAMSGFLSEDECARLRDMIDAVARPSSLYETSLQEIYRTSSSGDMDRYDPFIRMIERRIDDLLGMEPEWGETAQGQRYETGQQFKQHFDWFHVGTPYWDREAKLGGQRSWTAMIFLNDVEEGGETHFHDAGFMVKPQMGALLTWNNATPAGPVNDKVLHSGLPPIKGTKYVLTKWYRTREWQPLRLTAGESAS